MMKLCINKEVHAKLAEIAKKATSQTRQINARTLYLILLAFRVLVDKKIVPKRKEQENSS